MDASVAHMMLATYTRTLEELQSIAVLLQEIRDVQKERLELDKNRAEAATAVAEEPASLDANEVADCAEIALKVFREDPMAERSTILRHLVAHHGSPSQFELEKVKGAKKVKLLKIKVNEKLKHVRFGTAAGTRFTIKEKHKDVLTDKAVVKDRAKANVLMSKYETIVPPKVLPVPLVELARDVFRKERTIGPTGTIQGLTKAQVAFMWAVALWTLHPKGSEILPLAQDDHYDEIKSKVAGILDPLADKQFQWSLH